MQSQESTDTGWAHGGIKMERPRGVNLIYSGVGIRCVLVHYIEQKDCMARFAPGGTGI